MDLRGKILGRNRVLLGSEAGKMCSPVKIEEALYAETHYTLTAWLEDEKCICFRVTRKSRERLIVPARLPHKEKSDDAGRLLFRLTLTKELFSQYLTRGS